MLFSIFNTTSLCAEFSMYIFFNNCVHNYWKLDGIKKPSSERMATQIIVEYYTVMQIIEVSFRYYICYNK